MERPLLLLTIDVEEDMPGWRVARTATTENARALPALQAMCEGLGVKPTYLCDYPMATEAAPRRILQDLARGGKCEIGAHLHPWNTPPFLGVPGRQGDERDVAYYLSELGPERFAKKLEALTRELAAVAGAAPTSFRAGRFGLDGPTCAVLAEQGYTVDSSVTPLVHHDEDGGPDFRRAPQIPYRPSGADLSARGDLPIVEIPVSVTLTRALPARLQRAYAKIPQKTRIRGLLSRDYLGLVDFAWLYPPRFDLPTMERAARAIVRGGNPILNVFLHSSELVAGASKLILSEADAEACLARLRGLLAYCVRDLDAVPATLTDAGRLAEAWLARRGDAGLR